MMLSVWHAAVLNSSAKAPQTKIFPAATEYMHEITVFRQRLTSQHVFLL
jgi:hypothetical protein